MRFRRMSRRWKDREGGEMTLWIRGRRSRRWMRAGNASIEAVRGGVWNCIHVFGDTPLGFVWIVYEVVSGQSARRS